MTQEEKPSFLGQFLYRLSVPKSTKGCSTQRQGTRSSTPITFRWPSFSARSYGVRPCSTQLGVRRPEQTDVGLSLASKSRSIDYRYIMYRQYHLDSFRVITFQVVLRMLQIGIWKTSYSIFLTYHPQYINLIVGISIAGDKFLQWFPYMPCQWMPLCSAACVGLSPH